MNEMTLVLNAGSSSVKFALFEAKVEPKLVFRGGVTVLETQG